MSGQESVDPAVATFRQEADDLLSRIESVILVIEENPQDRDAINGLFRAVHTLKGSSGMCGFDNVANFSHGLESILDKVRTGQLAINRELIDLVLAYRDQVDAMLHRPDVTADDLDRIGNITRRLQALQPDSDGTAARKGVPRASQERSQGIAVTYRIRFAPQACLFATGTNPLLLLDELRGLGECSVIAHDDAVPPLDQADPESCYLSWDIILTTKADLNAVRDVFVFVESISEIEVDDISTDVVLNPDMPTPKLGEILVGRGDVTPSEVDAQLEKHMKFGKRLVESGVVTDTKIEAALKEQQTLSKQQQASKGESVRVPSEKLDSLINLLGELVINQARLSQIAHTMGNMTLAAPVEEADRLTNELRDIVLNIRMMPIGTTFSRFKRLVRDLSVGLGKQIELVTEGAETELDKTVIDRLGDPLVHLIRNSIDHGIEMPEERAQSGKPEKGTIKLTAVHAGASVVISIIDDGRGLDTARILAKAREKGLIADDAELSDKAIYDLIFLPGFSTASNVTDVSGRGVGMDVVRREMESLRGTISVGSDAGRGTRIDLSLPLTLAIIDGLLVHAEQQTYVVPLTAIEGCLELTAECYATSRERNLINVRGKSIPLVRLRELFRLEGDRPPLEQVVVVNVGDFRVGLVVDEVIGNHQTVIKSLGKVYRKADCVSGATILGDGMVAMILDLAAIIRNAQADEDALLARVTENQNAA